jgi:imidazolonepropionase-like amidohydrolase
MQMKKLLAIAVFLILFARTGGAQLAVAPLALIGGTVYVSPTDNPISNGVVLIRDGRIAAVGRAGSVAIPRTARTLNCTGLTITAGFWNSHVHFMERKWTESGKMSAADLARQLQAMLTRYGVTSAFDTGSSWETTRRIRDRVESGEVPGPRIRSAGEPLFAKGSFSPGDAPAADALGFMRYMPSEVGDAAEASAVAKAHLNAGTDAIKVYAANYFPPFLALPEDVMRAAFDEARKRGKPAFAHPTTRAGLLAAVRAGADVIVHTTPDGGPWDDSVLRIMRQANVAVIPTLKLFGYELRHDQISVTDRLNAAARGQLKAWIAAGGTVLFGTDVGYMSEYDPSDEYALMAEAGMTFRQILASLTTAPAEKFGDSARLGRIATGLAADLTVLNQDPSRDVRALANVRYTVRDGKLIYEAPK